MQVWTFHPTGGWTQRGANISVVFVDGDQFGARALANGTVEVYKNGVLLATRSITGWVLYASGGYIGLWFADATDARLDDFGGGNVSVGPTNTPTPVFTDTVTFTPTNTPIVTPTDTPVPTLTFTNTPFLTPTNTSIPTSTFTSTATLVPTNTFTPIPTSAQDIYRVAVNGVSNSSCGTSWSNPCNLQYALNTLANAGDELWVRQGVYTPGTARTSTFQLENGVPIYGGFDGTETARNQRNADPSTNNTILSGDIGTAGAIADNVYTVVTISGALANSYVLDGFTITAGNSNGGVGHGGGILHSRQQSGSHESDCQ